MASEFFTPPRLLFHTNSLSYCNEPVILTDLLRDCQTFCGQEIVENAILRTSPTAAELIAAVEANPDSWADLDADNAADCALDALQLAYDNWCDDHGWTNHQPVQIALQNCRVLLNELTIMAWAKWDRREALDNRTDDEKYMDRLAQYNDATREFWRKL